MSEGFGICGHKNNFNSKVRCGNWVEDNIGAALVQSRIEPSMEKFTTTSSTYIAPNEMENKASRGFPEVNEAALADVRAGLKGGLLFGHGQLQNSGDKERFQTMNGLMLNMETDRSDAILQVKKRTANAPGVKTILPKQQRYREMQKKLSRDSRMDRSYMTTTAGSQIKTRHSIPNEQKKALVAGRQIVHNGSFTSSFSRGSHVARE